MSETSSQILPLGTLAPEFNLFDTVSNKPFGLQTLKSTKATVIMFLCNHCPYVKHILAKLLAVAKLYEAKNVRFIAISSNDAHQYPEDGPTEMTAMAKQFQFTFPYLYDETQEVAKAYSAACTPDLYVFDQGLRCVYRGRFDDSTPGNNKPVTGKDLTEALDNVLSNKPVHSDQKPSVGCSIKWKKAST